MPRRSPLFDSRFAAFHVIAKPAGPQCNLACGYCFYRDKDWLNPERGQIVMDDALLASFVRQYIEAQDAPLVSFTWQGGEPTLLGVGFFRRVVELQRRYANGKQVENAFQTNGVLLDDKWGEFLAAERFLVGISIDGPGALHDEPRRDHGAHGSLKRVLTGLAVLQRHRVEVNALCCVHRANGDAPLDVYRFLRDLGLTHMQFIPVVERASQATGRAAGQGGGGSGELVTAWSVGREQYGRFLCAVFEEWVRRDVGRVFVQSFEGALTTWMGREASLCLFRPTCGLALVVEHNGDVYACDHFVEPGYRLGNLTQAALLDLVGGAAQTRFGLVKACLPKACRECDVRVACEGGCPKDRFVPAADGEQHDNYLCPSYRQFFRHVDPYMRFMAEALQRKESPAGVMAWARTRGPGTVRTRPQASARCSCGSGRKYRVCCGR